jgi:hypothetical protein
MSVLYWVEKKYREQVESLVRLKSLNITKRGYGVALRDTVRQSRLTLHHLKHINTYLDEGSEHNVVSSPDTPLSSIVSLLYDYQDIDYRCGRAGLDTEAFYDEAMYRLQWLGARNTGIHRIREIFTGSGTPLQKLQAISHLQSLYVPIASPEGFVTAEEFTKISMRYFFRPNTRELSYRVRLLLAAYKKSEASYKESVAEAYLHYK